MSVANPKSTAIRQNAQQHYKELNELLDGPIGLAYATKLYQIPQENEWTIMENLVHIVEFLPYWSKEVVKLIEHPGQNFGRTKEDEVRNAALREHGHDTLTQTRAALPGSYAELDETLSTLTDDQLELIGYHSRLGKRTLEWFIYEFILDHLRDHVAQIQKCMAQI